MRTSNVVSFLLLLASLSWTASMPSLNVQGETNSLQNAPLFDSALNWRSFPATLRNEIHLLNYHSEAYAYTERAFFSGGGIKEEIPERYGARYQQWKSEFLSTETGRRQWLAYAQNKKVALTISISKENQHGATTGRYKWNDSGELVGVTITLGGEIDQDTPALSTIP